VRYDGQGFVRVEGAQFAQLNPGQVQELVAAFENINFFAMPAQLSYGIYDLEETRTCIALFKATKCVEIRSTRLPAEAHIDIAPIPRPVRREHSPTPRPAQSAGGAPGEDGDFFVHPLQACEPTLRSTLMSFDVQFR
jgi:hypothetical protein